MAETIPTGTPNPDATQNQQETRAERRQRRRNLAREATARERTANLETQTQAAALQETDTTEVGTGLLGQIANFPIDVAMGMYQAVWKMTKGTAKFGGRAAVGAVKYPALGGGVAVLAGGGMAGGALYLLGKGAKIALAHPTQWAIHYDKKFGEGFDMTWKPIMAYASGKKK